jgi:hypothetical protein
MAITTKTRKDLKSYFVKNAIPTEGNFADLVDAQLNQSDDGVFKLAGEPLSVVAASGDQKRVLRLYSNYPAANPDWLISLNPAQKSGETSYRAGFGITDAPGNTRLFIDATTGNLGVGTNNPQAKLDVNGAARVGGDLEATGAAKFGSLRVTNALTPSAGSAETAGIMFPADAFGGTGDRAWIRYHNARGGEKCTLELGTANDVDDHILLNPSGNVGIGIADPQAKLDVAGNARVSGNLQVSGNVSAPAGLIVEGTVAHIDRDGALYRNTDGQVYLTVDDNLYIRKSGSNTWAAHFDLHSANLNLKGTLKASGGVHAAANGGVLNIEGTDHAYIQWYPMTFGAGRKGWIGYGSANTTTMHIQNDAGALNLGSATTLSIVLGGRERFVLESSGQLTIKFDNGYWRFQNDGNLVKYNNSGQALWALNKVSGVAGW